MGCIGISDMPKGKTRLLQLFTHREDVDLVNATELKALPGEAKQFVAKDTGNEEALRMSCPVSSVLVPSNAILTFLYIFLS